MSLLGAQKEDPLYQGREERWPSEDPCAFRRSGKAHSDRQRDRSGGLQPHPQVWRQNRRAKPSVGSSPVGRQSVIDQSVLLVNVVSLRGRKFHREDFHLFREVTQSPRG